MLSEFLADINSKSYSKASHFDVRFQLPRALTSGAGQGGSALITNRDIAIRCESADLPGRQLVTIDNKVYGPIYKTAYQSLFTDLNLTFLETKDMDFRYAFERWMEYIHPTLGSNDVEYYDSYTVPMTITQYDIVGDMDIRRYRGKLVGTKYKKTLTYNIYEAFPVNINQLTGSWSDDGFHKLQVSFAYRRHGIVQEKVPGFQNRIPPAPVTSAPIAGSGAAGKPPILAFNLQGFQLNRNIQDIT
jgi:hypothetical protein